MAQYSRIQVINQMTESGIVPLFYHPEIDVARSVLKACYDGGARLMEFTNRGDFALEIFTDLIKYSIKELPGMIIGIGSVSDAASASQFMLQGANFIVTPVFRKDIAIVCNRRKVLWSPGCGSLTEISIAEEMRSYLKQMGINKRIIIEEMRLIPLASFFLRYSYTISQWQDEAGVQITFMN